MKNLLIKLFLGFILANAIYMLVMVVSVWISGGVTKHITLR
jgi:F0F1-type ATP synthase membrane subunit c/vacuolar-type H+-ATPase subunit K